MQNIREFLRGNTPIPTLSLREILRLILQENSFEFKDKNHLQIHGTAMGTKMAMAFANIFILLVETEIISIRKTKPLEWKRYINDIFSLWNADKKDIEDFNSSGKSFDENISNFKNASAKMLLPQSQRENNL